MLFRPRLLPGALIGSIVTAGVAGGTGYLAYLVANGPISLNSFFLGLSVLFLAVLVVLFAYWTYCFWTLRYTLDRNALTIFSGFSREIVPLGNISRIVPREKVPWVGPVRGLKWFGYCRGRALVEHLGYATYHCAHARPEDLLYLVTPARVYAVTPRDGKRFSFELGLRQELGASRPVTQGHQAWWVSRLPFWRDRPVLVVTVLALLTNLSIFALIAQAYPDLPELLSLHFTAQGVVDRVGFRADLLELPAMAFVVLAFNWVLGLLFHARERMVAYLLLLGALAVQGLFWVAVVRIIY